VRDLRDFRGYDRAYVYEIPSPEDTKGYIMHDFNDYNRICVKREASYTNPKEEWWPKQLLASQVIDSSTTGCVIVKTKSRHMAVTKTKFLNIYDFNDYDRIYVKREEKKEMTNKVLYVVKHGIDINKYVFKIAVNSLGQAVVEVKGTGEVFAIDPKSLEKVVPYSIDVHFVSDTGVNVDRVYAYWVKPGTVEVGDFIFSDVGSSHVIVRAVDTKSEQANKFITGCVIKPSAILTAE
jgi:hypothetical protein